MAHFVSSWNLPQVSLGYDNRRQHKQEAGFIVNMRLICIGEKEQHQAIWGREMDLLDAKKQLLRLSMEPQNHRITEW